MKTILVSLISDQTIPNVQFIKEKLVDEYLFISTEEMEKKGMLNWITKATNITPDKLKKIIVSPFLYDKVYSEIEKVLDPSVKYIVNLTGGTKIMTLAVNDLFRTFDSEMYYLSGNTNYIKIYPERSKNSFQLKNKLSLSEYLIACGFEINNQSEAKFGFEVSERIFNYFLNAFNKVTDLLLLEDLRVNYRGKNLESISDIPGLHDFIIRLNYTPLIKNKLNKKETKFLTGDWFEEYFYFQLMKVKEIDVNNLGTGWIISKNDVPNEFDVLCVVEDKLNVIECKTFIWKDFNETQTVIAETIYKADSLKNKFGLFAKTSIVTLSDLSVPRLRAHIERAKESNISVFGKEQLLNIENILENII